MRKCLVHKITIESNFQFHSLIKSVCSINGFVCNYNPYHYTTANFLPSLSDRYAFIRLNASFVPSINSITPDLFAKIIFEKSNFIFSFVLFSALKYLLFYGDCLEYFFFTDPRFKKYSTPFVLRNYRIISKNKTF